MKYRRTVALILTLLTAAALIRFGLSRQKFSVAPRTESATQPMVPARTPAETGISFSFPNNDKHLRDFAGTAREEAVRPTEVQVISVPISTVPVEGLEAVSTPSLEPDMTTEMKTIAAFLSTSPYVTPARLKKIIQRRNWPVAIALEDGLPVHNASNQSEPVYTLATGDLVHVSPDHKSGERARVSPGVIVKLGGEEKLAIAGERLPDIDGWVQISGLHFFTDEQSKAFLQTTDPITLGGSSSFSMLSFYERAMKNPDVTVHRMIAPRLIAILDIHEDNVATWSTLYRDWDPKIRSLSISALKKRGIKNSPIIVEDLISRLAQLTQDRVTGMVEAETIAIIRMLKESGVTRGRTALESFAESWRGIQSERVMEALDE